MATQRKIKKSVSFTSVAKLNAGSGDQHQDASASALSGSTSPSLSASASATSSPSLSKSDTNTGSFSNDTSAVLDPAFLALNASFYLVPFHMILMIITLFQHFKITEDVQEASRNSFFAILVLQNIYGMMISESLKKPSKKSKKSSGPDSGDYLYLSVATVFTVASAIPLHLILVLLGAPIGSLTIETFYLSSHLSFLTTYPLLIAYKFTSPNAGKKWLRLLTFQVPEFYKNQIYMSVLGSLAGCWLGVMPIPLDWDRDWQAWPITLLVGGYFGSFVGGLLGWAANRLL